MQKLLAMSIGFLAIGCGPRQLVLVPPAADSAVYAGMGEKPHPGFRQLDSIAKVRGRVTPEEIERAANLVDASLTRFTAKGAERARSLSKTASLATWVGKISQYVGGAGAVLFGFKGEGDEAGVSGALVAAGTLIESGLNPQEKVQQAVACRALARDQIELKFTTDKWRTFKNDPVQQASFQTEFEGIYRLIRVAVQACDETIAATNE